MKYFLNEISNRDAFVDNLVFEGSNDNESYTILHTADGNVHEGWNYVKFDDASQPKYRYYRMRGKSADIKNACRIN
jgi:hypothetical protein